MKKNRKALYFYAYWCENSMKIKSQVYEACKTAHMRLEFIDCEDEDGVNLSIKYGVRNVPTLLFVENGKEVGREKGNYCYENVNKYL